MCKITLVWLPGEIRVVVLALVRGQGRRAGTSSKGNRPCFIRAEKGGAENSSPFPSGQNNSNSKVAVFGLAFQRGIQTARTHREPADGVEVRVATVRSPAPLSVSGACWFTRLLTVYLSCLTRVLFLLHLFLRPSSLHHQ